jgi:hypothetical protein
VRLARIGEADAEKQVALVGDAEFVDISDVVHDLDREFFPSGGIARVSSVVAERAERGEVQSLGATRLGPPVARPHQFFGTAAADTVGLCPP